MYVQVHKHTIFLDSAFAKPATMEFSFRVLHSAPALIVAEPPQSTTAKFDAKPQGDIMWYNRTSNK